MSRRRVQRFLFGAFLLAMLLSSTLASFPAFGETSSASADAIVSVAGSQAGLDWADHLAERLVSQLPSPPPINSHQARELLEQGPGAAGVKRAAVNARQARAAMKAFEDLDSTTRLLSGAVDGYLSHLPLLQNIDEPLQLLLDLATVELALDHQEQVQTALEKACRLDPSFDLDPQEVSPSLARAAQSARAAIADQSLLTVEQVRDIGARLGASTLLVVQPRPDQTQVLVEEYRIATGARVRHWQVRVDDLSSVAGELSGRVAISRGAGSHGQPPDETEPVDSRSDRPSRRRAWYRRWWFWTIVGTAVAGGAAVGVYFGVQARQQPENLPLEVQGHW